MNTPRLSPARGPAERGRRPPGRDCPRPRPRCAARARVPGGGRDGVLVRRSARGGRLARDDRRAARAPRGRRRARRAGVVSTMPLASGKSARAKPRTSLSAIAAKTSTNGGPSARWAASARAPAGLWAPSSRRAGSPGIRCSRPGQCVRGDGRGHALELDREAGARRFLEQADRHEQVVALVGTRQRREFAVASRGRLDRDERLRLTPPRSARPRPGRRGVPRSPVPRARAPGPGPRGARRPRAARSRSRGPRAARRPSRARSRRACGRGTPRGRSPR